MNNQDKVKARQTANLMLVEAIKALVEANPEHRFGQILANYGFLHNNAPEYQEGYLVKESWWTDEFNLESVDLLDRVNNNLEERK